MLDTVNRLSDITWEIPKQGKMKVPSRIYASEKILQLMKEDQTLEQTKNTATLPGIYKYSIVLPDGHQGYVFPIGGVVALDKKNGGISPGGIGYDINCGVRLLKSNLDKDDIYLKINQLLNQLFDNVPAGLGSSNIKVSNDELNSILNREAQWAFDNEYGIETDFLHCEENGRMNEANSSIISNKSMKRGKKQVATLGSGNYFLEVQYVDKIFDKKIANIFGITHENQVTVLIHCGSRGFGHQVCSDYLRRMEKTFPDIVSNLPDKELVYAPANHQLCEEYFQAMSCAANFAWCNRFIIGHQVRESFSNVFSNVDLKTVYDVAHNICKVETHTINGEQKEVFMHRKGSTRALGKDHVEIPQAYRSIGKPIIIPGNMETATFLLDGTKEGMETTFGSTPHGAGRTMSRRGAKKEFTGNKVKQRLKQQKIFIKSASKKVIAQEAPGVYKDVEEVVDVTDKSGIGKKVARLKPIGVIKG
jgi:tRNA-splicing ligase RtcB